MNATPRAAWDARIMLIHVMSANIGRKGGVMMGAHLFNEAASGAAAAVTAADWSSVISAMTGQISVSTIVAVLATLVTAGIGLVFMWWGVRKAIRSLMAAFRKGKMSI
jgi:hypothetical protein